MNAITLYVTFESDQQAKDIAAKLVEQKLVACANIFPAHQSIYRWQGKVERAQEVAALFKTREDLFAAAEAAIKALHSYDCPCIIAWPITNGYGPFIDWIAAETAEPDDIYS